MSRSSEWWEFKIVPALVAVYATAAFVDVPVVSLWPVMLQMLIALAAGGAFASVVNDLTDRDDDTRAGKHNRLHGVRRPWPLAMLAMSLGAGLAVAWVWRNSPGLLAVFAIGWIAFSAYSLPPIRLKRRGAAGVLADAVGANLVPALLGTLLVFEASGKAADPLWCVGVTAWSLGWGIRGIVWHQLVDRENDQAIGLPTLATRHPVKTVVGRVGWVVFPIEILGLSVLLAEAPAPAIAALFAAGWLTYVKIERFRTHLIVVEPRKRYTMVLQDYYEVFLPLGLLIGAALSHAWDLIALALHLVLFPSRWRHTVDEIKASRDPQFTARGRDFD